MKKGSNFLAIRELQVKTPRGCRFTPLRMSARVLSRMWNVLIYVLTQRKDLGIYVEISKK